MTPVSPVSAPPDPTRRGARLTDPARQSMLLTALYVAQERHGALTPAAIAEVAARLDLPVGQVFSTASFYSLFRLTGDAGDNGEPGARYVIQVCDGLSCYLRDGADRIVDYLARKLDIEPGATTPDGRFTLQRVQCLASCGTAPALRVNDVLVENLTPASLDTLLEQLSEEW